MNALASGRSVLYTSSMMLTLESRNTVRAWQVTRTKPKPFAGMFGNAGPFEGSR